MNRELKIVETLNDDFVNQLSSLYEDTWFTQNRSIDDIKIMLNNCYLTLGFVESDKLVGFCRVVSDGIYKAFLFDVIVRDEYRNKGIGRFMMDSLLNHSKLVHVKHIELYCPEKITPFYRKLGFDVRTSLLMRYEN